MTAAAFYWCIPAFLTVNSFMAILAQFMGSFLIAVHIWVAYVQSMADGALLNYHYFALGMMADSAGIFLLVLPMREISWFSGSFSLQRNFCRPYTDLQAECIYSKNKYCQINNYNFE